MDEDEIDRCSTLRHWRGKEPKVEEELFDRFRSIEKDPHEEQPKHDQDEIHISRRNTEKEKNNEFGNNSSTTQHQHRNWAKKERTKSKRQKSSI